MLARLRAARAHGAGAGFAAFETIFGRVHRNRWAQSDCGVSIGRRLRDFGKTEPA